MKCKITMLAMVVALFSMNASAFQPQPTSTQADDEKIVGYCGAHQLTITDEGARMLVDGKEYFSKEGRQTPTEIAQIYMSSDHQKATASIQESGFYLILGDGAPDICHRK